MANRWPARVILIRHLKSGKDVTAELSASKARQYAGQMLWDNASLSKKEAQDWAANLVLGRRNDHPSGYAVTVLPVVT